LSAGAVSAGLASYDRAVDADFHRWLAALPPQLRPGARRLPHDIGLSDQPRWCSWRSVFATPVMRALPCLVAEGFPGVSRTHVRALGTAHALLVFLAFLDDRLNDGQAHLTRETNLIRRSLEAELQRQLAVAVGADRPFWKYFQRAFAAYTDAHAREPALWAGTVPDYTHAQYARDAAAKIAIGKLPALAVAGLGGAEPARLNWLSKLLDHCMIALQYVDDVHDWEEDFSGGRFTYFVLCHLSRAEARRQAPVRRAELRARVVGGSHASEFLTRAARHYRACLSLLDGASMATMRGWVEQRCARMMAEAAMRPHPDDAERQSFAAALRQCWEGNGRS
jgi:hypothetical protein